MARRARSLVLGAAVLAAGAIAAGVHWARSAPPPATAAPAIGSSQPLGPESAASAAQATADKPTPFTELPALEVFSLATKASLHGQLYTATGHVDEAQALRLDVALADLRDPRSPQQLKIDRRLLQLLFRAAYHFRSSKAEIVSGYRKPQRRREGPHGLGHAVDFKLAGVAAPALAAYLRTFSRVGVGVYTHPRTQYVHLDVRELSFHWIDASPPRRHWRERSLGTRNLAARDRNYDPAQDWPEGLEALRPSAVAQGPQENAQPQPTNVP